MSLDLSPLTTGSVFRAASIPAMMPTRFCPGQLDIGCFFDAGGGPTCRSFREDGFAGGALSIGVPSPTRFASTFCIAPTALALLNFIGGLPGPGGITLAGTVTLIGP